MMIGSRTGLDLGRVKTLRREEYVERSFSPTHSLLGSDGKTFFFTQTATAAGCVRSGKLGAGRTRFPSVNVLSEFLHNRGQILLPWEEPKNTLDTSDDPEIPDTMAVLMITCATLRPCSTVREQKMESLDRGVR